MKEFYGEAPFGRTQETAFAVSAPTDVVPIVVPPGVEYDGGPQPSELNEHGDEPQFPVPAQDITGQGMPAAEDYVQEHTAQNEDNSANDTGEPTDVSDTGVPAETSEAILDSGEAAEATVTDKLRENLGTVSKREVIEFLGRHDPGRAFDLAGQLIQNSNGALLTDVRPAMKLVPTAYNEDDLPTALDAIKGHIQETSAHDTYGVMLAINGPEDIAAEGIAQQSKAQENSMAEHPDVATSHYTTEYPDRTPIGTIEADQVEALAAFLLANSPGDEVPNVLILGCDADVKKLRPGTFDELVVRYAETPEPDKMFGAVGVSHAREGKNMDPIVAWEDFKIDQTGGAMEAGWAMTLRAYMNNGGINRDTARGETSELMYGALTTHGGQLYRTSQRMVVSPRRIYQELAHGGLPSYGQLYNDDDIHREGLSGDISPDELRDRLDTLAPTYIAAVALNMFNDAYNMGATNVEAADVARHWVQTRGRVALQLFGGPPDALDTPEEFIRRAVMVRPARRP